MPVKSTAQRRSRVPLAEVPSTARELDRIDRQLLTRLQQDGRLPISELAAEVHLSVSPCFARVRRLESLGYITGYFAHLNPTRLGLGLQAYISVQLDTTTSEVFKRFAEQMVAFDEVLECHMVGGGFDYLVKVRVKDMAAFRKFLGEKMASVRGIQQTHTYFVMEEVKSTHRLDIPAS
jgi:Lrp/AsnC family transcriptional regulator, leucine-responsive regulatory protein